MKIRSFWLAMAASISMGCTSLKHHRMDAAQLPLAPADYEVLGWVEAEACATYAFGIMRTPKSKDPNRAGFLNAGSVIGGFIPDKDSAEALYLAMQQYPDVTHLLTPRYEVDASGMIIAGVMLFGKRCSKAKAMALSVTGSFGGSGASAPAPRAVSRPQPTSPKPVQAEPADTNPEPAKPTRDNTDWE